MLKKEGFTLIELVMVIIILGILAAVAIPRYVDMVATAEAGAEDAVIARIRAGLEVYATEKLITTGNRTWPDDPFEALETKPEGYRFTVDANGKVVPTNTGDAGLDGEWTFNLSTENITHQRGDNTKWHWDYTKPATANDLGVLGDRQTGAD